MISTLKNFRWSIHILLLGIGLALGTCGGKASRAVAVATPSVPPPEMRILVLGQSISSNCNEHIYGPVDRVFQIGKNGEVKNAQDPFEWADCTKGSMWMPLGKRMVESGIASKVIFMPIGVGATKVSDWQEGGLAFDKLNNAITLVKQQGIRFDFAFWHQGSSDFGNNKVEYLNRLSSIVTYVNKNVKISRWLIAVHSRCYGNYDLNVEAAQIEFGNRKKLQIYPGPNTNLLGDDYRIDTCHLNQKGQEEMGVMWLNSVRSAIK